jgi:hypothetical protein
MFGQFDIELKIAVVEATQFHHVRNVGVAVMHVAISGHGMDHSRGDLHVD